MYMWACGCMCIHYTQVGGVDLWTCAPEIAHVSIRKHTYTGMRDYGCGCAQIHGYIWCGGGPGGVMVTSLTQHTLISLTLGFLDSDSRQYSLPQQNKDGTFLLTTLVGRRKYFVSFLIHVYYGRNKQFMGCCADPHSGSRATPYDWGRYFPGQAYVYSSYQLHARGT